MDTGKQTVALDLDSLDGMDEANMNVFANGKPTGWIWTFAGPGHAQAIEQSNRISRDTLNRNRLKEQAQVNGKKWKAPDQTPDELREDNVRFVMERLLRWSDVTMGGQPYPFTAENARALLMDRKKVALLQQAVEFILDDNSFTKPSAAS